MKFFGLLFSCVGLVSMGSRPGSVSLNILDTGIIGKNATLEMVADGFIFTEGVSVDRQGTIYFTDQPNNKIWKYDTGGKLSLYLDSAGRSNGMYVDKRGNLITCADENNQLWLIDKKTKKVKVLADNFGGHRLNGPNDVWLAPNGDIYFTDPYYQRPYWTRTKPDIATQDVYLLSRKTHEVRAVASGFKRPNGIVGTPNGRYLYVSDIGDNKTYRYDIMKDGSLAERQLFAPIGSDGMTLDNKGNVYLTFNGVTVFDPNGKQVLFIPVPQQTSNVAFGGKNKDELFITASKALYRLKMNVRGVE